MQQDSLFNLQELTSDTPFIQALKQPEFLKDVYLMITVALLLTIILVKVSRNIQFNINSKRFFIEEETYSIFRSKGQSRFLNTVLDINALVQFTFLVFFIFRDQIAYFSSDLMKILLVFSVLLLLFLLRIVSFSILDWLTSSKVNPTYFRFTHFNAFRILSIFILIMNLLVLSGNQLPFRNILFIMLGLFYAWLILRYLLIGVRYGVLKNLYFFIYLCTLEIAPILIVIKIGLLSY